MIKVLIVDDSIFSQKVIGNTLKKIKSDLEISFANDGEEGFQCYKDLKPDYVLLDLLMPKVNGQELIRLIKGYDQEAKLIVVSADVQKSIKEEIEQYNILGFVNKPFTEEKAHLICDMMKESTNE